MMQICSVAWNGLDVYKFNVGSMYKLNTVSPRITHLIVALCTCIGRDPTSHFEIGKLNYEWFSLGMIPIARKHHRAGEIWFIVKNTVNILKAKLAG